MFILTVFSVALDKNCYLNLSNSAILRSNFTTMSSSPSSIVSTFSFILASKSSVSDFILENCWLSTGDYALKLDLGDVCLDYADCYLDIFELFVLALPFSCYLAAFFYVFRFLSPFSGLSSRGGVSLVRAGFCLTSISHS